MARRTKDEALATRHRILDAAELLFQQHGVSRTTLQDIAQAADVTRGAIYWHFEDKADLFNAMMERATLPMEETLAAHAGEADAQDPLHGLELWLIHGLRLMAEHAPTRRVFEIATHKVEYVDELQAVRERHLHNRGECLAHVEQQLKQAMKLGQIGRGTPARAAALGLHALVDGLIQNWMLDPTAFDLVKVGRQVLRAYLAGLRPAEAH
ncbi:MAG: TetR family transcriptional regulator [Burkholderiales bacterium]|nr:TetR family transcriptional regulator [Burkholderiales bacterium]